MKIVKIIGVVIFGLILAVPLLYYGGIWLVVTQPLFFVETVGSQIQLDPSRLEAHVRALSEACAPRDYTHPKNLECAAEYIQGHFDQTGGRVSDQPYEVEGQIYRNLAVQFGPATGERIVIGAHYDVYGPYPGANDDASGIAALIELAYLLANTPLPITVELVAFTLEEPPFYGSEEMGSAVHAAALKERDIPVRVMIAIDEIGYYSEEPGSQSLPIYRWLKRFYSSTANFIAILGPLDTGLVVRQVKAAMVKASDLPVYSFNAPVEMESGVILGDHRNYVEQGYVGIIVTDTAFLRSNIKHSEFDTADTLDYERMSQVVIGLYEAIRSLAK